MAARRLLVDGACVGGAPTGGAEIVLVGGRIAEIRPRAAPGNGWLALPAFANAHVHLDLSAIDGAELPRRTFAEWAVALVEQRRRLSAEAIDAAVARGIAELLESGTAAVGDIDSTGRSEAVVRRSALEGVVYRELIGELEAARAAALEEELAHDSGGLPGASLRRGLSPHAPFSTAESTYRRCFDWAERLGVPVASHVAETAEEEELLQHGRGPLAELFRRWELAPPRWSSAEARPLARVLALAPPRGRFVLIHGNRLDNEELAAVARAGIPIVYCPRSHRYFGRAPHPAAKLLAMGGQLALGTDSRASNDGLDLWAEMASFRDSHAALDDAAILAAATRGGRSALGLEPAELRPGEPATFQLARSRDGGTLDASRLVAAAVRGELATRAVFVRGSLVSGAEAGLPVLPNG